MNKKFSIWFLFMLLSLGLLYFGFELKFLHRVWEADVSKLSFVILGIFYFAFIRLGVLLYKDNITKFDLDPGFEAAEISLSLGMLGTIIGFIAMTASFVGVDFSNVENIKNLFTLATTGMSTALYTTATGLISGLVLRFSHYLAERDL